MELKEYIGIIKRHRWVFIGVWLIFIGAVFFWQAMRPLNYDVSMSLEVTRMSSEKTEDYQYDQYYRLEADDKFSDTVVQWMKDPAVVHNILSGAGIPFEGTTLGKLSKTFSTEKLASNYIRVKFQVPKPGQGDKIAENISIILNSKIDDLNRQPQTGNWFSLVYGKPIVSQAKADVALLAVFTVVGGFLAAVMSVLLTHYWKEQL